MAIFLITAPSGAGKTSIMERVVRMMGNKNVLGECISHTTREMRDGEENGKTYYFKDKKKFDELDAEGYFAEKVVYDGNSYGVSKSEIDRVLKTHEHVYIIVEYNGYKQIKEVYPDAVGIFLHMSKEDCFANMLLRGDSFEKANKRIYTYEEEMANRVAYDYVIKNVRGQQTAVSHIITSIVLMRE